MISFSNIIRNRKGIIKNVIIIISIIWLYEVFICNTSVIKSDDNFCNTINIEQNISDTCEYIVGISKTYEVSNEGWGSGIIISKDGYILTNNHVARDTCFVVISTKEKYKANIVWSDYDLDLAILKVNHRFDNCAILGDSYELKVGQSVYSIGNPISYDFNKSVSHGIVSALNRSIELDENNEKSYLSNLIQTDINTNPGNSGGALINELGEVIGVTTIKITSADGISFSVPINIIKTLISKLEEGQELVKVTIGISGYDRFSIEKYNNEINLNSGIYIAVVTPNSSAEHAGLKSGDIIKSIDGTEINTLLELKEILYRKSLKEKANIVIERDNRIHHISCSLDEKK